MSAVVGRHYAGGSVGRGGNHTWDSMSNFDPSSNSNFASSQMQRGIRDNNQHSRNSPAAAGWDAAAQRSGAEYDSWIYPDPSTSSRMVKQEPHPSQGSSVKVEHVTGAVIMTLGGRRGPDSIHGDSRGSSEKAEHVQGSTASEHDPWIYPDPSALTSNLNQEPHPSQGSSVKVEHAPGAIIMTLGGRRNPESIHEDSHESSVKGDNLPGSNSMNPSGQSNFGRNQATSTMATATNVPSGNQQKENLTSQDAAGTRQMAWDTAIHNVIASQEKGNGIQSVFDAASVRAAFGAGPLLDWEPTSAQSSTKEPRKTKGDLESVQNTWDSPLTGTMHGTNDENISWYPNARPIIDDRAEQSEETQNHSSTNQPRKTDGEVESIQDAWESLSAGAMDDKSGDHIGWYPNARPIIGPVQNTWDSPSVNATKDPNEGESNWHSNARPIIDPKGKQPEMSQDTWDVAQSTPGDYSTQPSGNSWDSTPAKVAVSQQNIATTDEAWETKFNQVPQTGGFQSEWDSTPDNPTTQENLEENSWVEPGPPREEKSSWDIEDNSGFGWDVPEESEEAVGNSWDISQPFQERRSSRGQYGRRPSRGGYNGNGNGFGGYRGGYKKTEFENNKISEFGSGDVRRYSIDTHNSDNSVPRTRNQHYYPPVRIDMPRGRQNRAPEFGQISTEHIAQHPKQQPAPNFGPSFRSPQVRVNEGTYNLDGEMARDATPKPSQSIVESTSQYTTYPFWMITDSGYHYTNDIDDFAPRTYLPPPPTGEPLTVAKHPVYGIGSVELSVRRSPLDREVHTLVLKKVLYIPSAETKGFDPGLLGMQHTQRNGILQGLGSRAREVWYADFWRQSPRLVLPGETQKQSDAQAWARESMYPSDVEVEVLGEWTALLK